MEQSVKPIVLFAERLDIGYHKKGGDIEVAREINIALERGELVGLVGPNGIGKSTLLRTISGIQPALKGNIRINGEDLSGFNPEQLARSLGLVLTEPLASKNLTVFELIALGRQPYTNWIGTLTARDNEVIDQSMNQTAVTELRDKRCFELSDGQLQKVMIARALAQDTDLIILDEPTTHLDLYHKAYILKLLQRLARETDKTILFSSHEIDLAIQLCDKLIVMTSEMTVIDTPENHIKQERFQGLFPKDLIEFDQNTGAFRVRK